MTRCLGGCGGEQLGGGGTGDEGREGELPHSSAMVGDSVRGLGTKWPCQWGLMAADRAALETVRETSGGEGGGMEYVQGRCREGWVKGIVHLLWGLGRGCDVAAER